jgi:hypothetical protein
MQKRSFKNNMDNTAGFKLKKNHKQHLTSCCSDVTDKITLDSSFCFFTRALASDAASEKTS